MEIFEKAAIEGIQLLSFNSYKWQFPTHQDLAKSGPLGILLDFDCEQSVDFLKSVRINANFEKHQLFG